MLNFRILGQPILGKKHPKERVEEREEKNDVNSGHYVLLAMSKRSACTLLGPITMQEMYPGSLTQLPVTINNFERKTSKVAIIHHTMQNKIFMDKIVEIFCIWSKRAIPEFMMTKL